MGGEDRNTRAGAVEGAELFEGVEDLGFALGEAAGHEAEVGGVEVGGVEGGVAAEEDFAPRAELGVDALVAWGVAWEGDEVDGAVAE